MATRTDATAPRGAEHTLLIVGGSLDHLGGLEAFSDRAAQALKRRGGWRTDRIAASSAYLTVGRLPAFMRGLTALFRYRRHKPDVVWIQYVNLPDLAYLVLAKLLGMQVMVTPHLGANWRSQTSPVLRSLSERALRAADRLALISRTQELEVNLPARVPRSHIRNFLPLEVLEAELPEASGLPPALQIIHSSRLSAGKGTFLLIEVCALLRDRGVPFHARITGAADDATMERLHQMIRDHALEDKVSVMGRVPEEDLIDHLRRSDVLVHLSRIDSYPLIVLEAMACSAVPVVMELAGARDMVETYEGHVVSTTGAVAETAGWLTACDLAELRRRRAQVAARVRTDYAWDRCAIALDQALRLCIRGEAGQTATAERPA